MTYRYCEECEKWLETSEYTVNSTGETVCPVDGHKAVVGYIGGMMTWEDFTRELPHYFENREKMIEDARNQLLWDRR